MQINNYILKGHISGIQEFIFNVSSKGAAKSLKARSYLIQVISHLSATFVLEKLPGSTLFYEGGGSFFIKISGAENDVVEKVRELQKAINVELLYDDFKITLAFVTFNEINFGSSWTSLRKESNIGRLRALEENFIAFKPFFKKEREAENNEERLSEKTMSELQEMGFDLSESNDVYKIIIKEFVKREMFVHKLFNTSIKLQKNDFEEKLVNKLPFWKSYPELDKYKAYRKKNQSDYPDNYKLENQNIIDFNAFGDFAAHRTGTNKIGILKLDVDNLGELFGNQMDEKKAIKLSSMFKDFFNEELYKIYKEKNFCVSGISSSYEPNVYPIFSGGDDSFIIGAWDAILCFTEELHEQFSSNFKNIVIDKKQISLSAGIIIVDSSHPVKSFADMVEAELSKAKSKEGKNAISIFGLIFSWEEYKHILKSSRHLQLLMEKNEINRSYLDKIRKSAKGFNALQNSDGADFNKIYKLRYYISKKNEKLDELIKLLFDPYYEALKNKLLKRKNSKYDTAIYPAIARITELLTKSKLNYETK